MVGLRVERDGTGREDAERGGENDRSAFDLPEIATHADRFGRGLDLGHRAVAPDGEAAAQLLDQASVTVLHGIVEPGIAIAPGIEDRDLLGGAALEELDPVPAKRSEAPGEIDHLACCDIMFSSGRSLNLVEHTEDHRVDVFAFGLVDPSPVDTDGSHPRVRPA